jgi:hypothetical protein
MSGSPSRVTGRKQACRVRTGAPCEKRRDVLRDRLQSLQRARIGGNGGGIVGNRAFAGDAADIRRAVGPREDLRRRDAARVAVFEKGPCAGTALPVS